MHFSFKDYRREPYKSEHIKDQEWQKGQLEDVELIKEKDKGRNCTSQETERRAKSADFGEINSWISLPGGQRPGRRVVNSYLVAPHGQYHTVTVKPNSASLHPQSFGTTFPNLLRSEAPFRKTQLPTSPSFSPARCCARCFPISISLTNLSFLQQGGLGELMKVFYDYNTSSDLFILGQISN